MFELKRLPAEDVGAALAAAQHCRSQGEAADAESICLDVLDVIPDHQGALLLLIQSRCDLLEQGLPGGIERARQPLSQLSDEYERTYYGGVICERQARFQLRQRGPRSGFVAYEWFQLAMEEFEAAARVAPDRPEPSLRWNACVRVSARTPHCTEAPPELDEQGIE